MGIAATFVTRAFAARAALWVLVATTVANVFGYGYQVVMARLLRPDDYAVLTALFGILILESLSAQVIQSATARIAAQYRARDEEAALHVFVRRWGRRIVIGAGVPAIAIVLAAPLVGPALALPVASVALLGLALFISAPLTFTGGLLQGLAYFGWFGWYFIAQALVRLVVGVALVVGGFGVTGAFVGAVSALGAGLLLSIVPLAPLLRAARGAVHTIELGRAESRFFLLASVIMLAYAGLTNIDAIASRALLPSADAGAYAGAVTMAKVVLFAPIAVGFILLERTARNHARGEDTDRGLLLALGFALATSGTVTLAYIVAPEPLTRLVVGDQYPLAASLIGPYAVAALLNALLSLWIAHFIGRGEMRFGVLLAVAVTGEIVAILAAPRDAASLVRVVLGVAAVTQAAALATYWWERRRRGPRAAPTLG
jgi:O-antigen/teichoic acid export membrane protein